MKALMKVLVTHAYSSDNKGDATLLSVLLSDIHTAFKKAQITVLTTAQIKDGEYFEQAKLEHSFMYHAFNRFHFRPAKFLYSLYIVISTLTWAYILKYLNLALPLPSSLKKVCEQYKNADLITGVGGGYLRGKADFTSTIELILLLHPLKIAHILDRPTVLYTQSVGPFSNKLQQILAQRVLKKVELIIVREDISLNILRQMDVIKNVVRSSDSAFSFRGNKSVDWRSELGLVSNKKVVGITVRSWLNTAKQTEYEKSFAALADNIAEKGYRVVFIPQVTCEHENDDDRSVAGRALKYMRPNNKTNEKTIVIDQKIDHHKIQSLYSQLDFLVGTRFHSVIFALKSYIPALAIEYEHKTNGIMRDLGLEDWVININEVTPAKLIEGVDLLVKSRDQYSKHLQKVIPAYVKQSQSTYKYLQQVVEKPKVNGRTLIQKSLFQNSFYLILSSAVMAAFGFFFWLINARLFTPSQIGIATMLISAMNLISLLSLVGFDTVLIRFLSHSKRPNAKINTAMALVAIAAAVLATGFILSMSLVAPKLLFMHKNPWLMAGFIIFCVSASWNVLTDAVFLAYRKAVYTLVINTIFSFEKMLLPFAFFTLGAAGIFTATGLASLTGFLLSIGAMVKKFDYAPKLTIDRQVLTEVRGYSTANYITSLSNLLPSTVIPFIVAAYLGTAKAAYFYIAFMIANLLYVIPLSASRSLFAEGAHSKERLGSQIKHVISFISLLTLPTIALLVIKARFLLQVFGKSYAQDGAAFLRLLAFAGIAVSAVTVINTIFRITKQLKPLLITNILYAVIVIFGSFIALQEGRGLIGIGWVWFWANIITGFVGFAWLNNLSRK